MVFVKVLTVAVALLAASMIVSAGENGPENGYCNSEDAACLQEIESAKEAAFFQTYSSPEAQVCLTTKFHKLALVQVP
jgi:hypothetical protein